MMIRRRAVSAARLARQFSSNSYKGAVPGEEPPRTAQQWIHDLIQSEGGGYRLDNAGIWNLPVDWGTMDAFQHVNNVQYLRWFETARMNFLSGLERRYLGTNVFVTGTEVGPIMRSVNLAWRYPIVYPDSVTVMHKVVGLEADRYHIDGIVISHKAKKVASRISETHVTIDYANGAVKTAVPDGWARLLLKEMDSGIGN